MIVTGSEHGNQATMEREVNMNEKGGSSRRTKIVATYGPALEADGRLRRLIECGADVIRLNFSHGDHARFLSAIQHIRAESERLGRVVAILQDLRGPKVRVGNLGPSAITLTPGEAVILASGASPGDPGTIPVDGYPTFREDVRPGEAILLNDGAIRLRAAEVVPSGVRCEVLVGGPLTSNKGINLPETKLRTLDTITAKDEADLAFGIENGVDWIALSFVRCAADVKRLRAKIEKHGADTPIIAKIEKREALQDLDAIVGSADGIMVARGDLGVETELEEVALRQKEIIRECNRQGKAVITATQMLESMIANPVPTRAEVSDVSNAIIDGSDAVMLSGETAVGAYPFEAVSFMARIAERTELMLDAERALARRPFLDSVPDAVAHAACQTAHEIKADALICLTRSGLTARLVSRYRPQCPILAVSPDPQSLRRLALVWGVRPVLGGPEGMRERLVDAALRLVVGAGHLRAGQKVVITGGVSEGVLRGQTNMVRTEVV
jgi:pyruvate kinase